MSEKQVPFKRLTASMYLSGKRSVSYIKHKDTLASGSKVQMDSKISAKIHSVIR